MAKKFDLSEAIAATVSEVDISFEKNNRSPLPRTIETITSEIVHLQRVGGEAVLGIGQRLIEAKAMLEHGQWCSWLSENVNYSERTAQNLMRIAREWQNPQALADLGAAKALLILSLPADERESFLEENHLVNGEEKSVVDMTSRELQKAISDRAEALAEKEAAIAEKNAAEAAREKMEADMAALKKLHEDSVSAGERQNNEILRLQKEIRDLKAKPVEVAVMSVDQEKIDAARAEATADMQGKLDKAIENKKKSEEKQKALEDEIASLRAKLEEAERNEKRAQISEDRDLAVFDLTFGQTQECINKLHGLYIKFRNRGDAELADKLKRALLALADSVRGCAE